MREKRSPLRGARCGLVLAVAGWMLLAAESGPAQGRSITASPVAPSAVTAAGGTQRIRDYAVDLKLTTDDVLHVRETIVYDFGADHRHGIERRIPVTFHYGRDQLREYPLDQIKVSSPSGAPADEQTMGGSTTTIRIGDPDNDNVTGRQTYVISYDVKGVVNSFSDHQELFWNAVGDQWDVPIDAARATARGPGAILKVACYQGTQGSTRTCPGTIGADGAAGFSAGALTARQGMTIVASFPTGTFPDAAPILKQRWTWVRAFSLTGTTLGAALALFALLGGGAIVQAARRGRDEHYLGLTPGLLPGFGQAHRVGRVPWLRRDPVAVQFAPPEGVRPGQIGALIDERAETRHVTATIIDLAVRGYLRIEEVIKPRKAKNGASAGDWKLVKLNRKPAKELRGYETALYDGLFSSGPEVRISRLRRTFGADLTRVKTRLEGDVFIQGWFRESPAKARLRWIGYGVSMILAGIGLTWALAAWSRYGLLGLGVVLAGIVVLWMSRRIPARSAKGTAVLAQTRGFRLYLETAEASQIRFEEGEDVFSRYLPFAIIFGVAERWAAAFAALAASGTSTAGPDWYVGSSLATAQGFNYPLFSQSMNDFSDMTSSSLATEPVSATSGSSGSSGFSDGGGYSGGGGGGGGGGSW